MNDPHPHNNQTHNIIVISPRWIAPVIPKNALLENHSIVIVDNKIEAIIASEKIAEHYPQATHHSLPNHLLIPGLINSHGHSAMSLLRGYADDKPLMDWLENHIWPAETQWVSEAFVKDGALIAIAEMIRGGTSCFSDMYFFPEQTAQAAESSGIRCQITFPVFDFPTQWGSGPDEYISKGLKLHDQYKTNAYVHVCFGPHAPYTISDEPLQKIATLSAELDIGVHIHLHETAFEVESAVEQTGMRPIERLNKLGILGPQTQCVHMTQITPEDIALLSHYGAHVIHCPESNLKLASGFCPVQQLLNAGINVALGTDGAASNNDLDLLGEAKTAALIAKGISQDATAVNAFTALEMATINGAKAMGIDHLIGSLEVGKLADIAAIDMSHFDMQPVFNPISQIIYTNSAPAVTHLWVGGKLIMENRQLLTMDIRELKARASYWHDKISST